MMKYAAVHRVCGSAGAFLVMHVILGFSTSRFAYPVWLIVLVEDVGVTQCCPCVMWVSFVLE